MSMIIEKVDNEVDIGPIVPASLRFGLFASSTLERRKSCYVNEHGLPRKHAKDHLAGDYICISVKVTLPRNQGMSQRFNSLARDLIHVRTNVARKYTLRVKKKYEIIA